MEGLTTPDGSEKSESFGQGGEPWKKHSRQGAAGAKALAGRVHGVCQ